MVRRGARCGPHDREGPAPQRRTGPPTHARSVTIQDEPHHYPPRSSPSAFTSTEFADEDDYYGAHFGSPVDDQQGEEYHQDEDAYEHCYVGIAEDTEEPLTTGTQLPPLPFHSAYLSAGIESPSSMARIHKMAVTPVPNTIVGSSYAAEAY